MGYTHFFRQYRVFIDEEWNNVLRGVRKVYANLPAYSHSSGGYYNDYPLIIHGPVGEGEPIFNEERISFNGDAENDLDHEPLTVMKAPRRGFEFCKTERKPYDLFVQAVLLICAHYHNKFIVTSDGDEDDWSEAVNLVNHVLGYNLRSLEDANTR